MKKRLGFMGLLVLVQGLCAAVGFWIFHQLLIVSSEWSVQDSVYSELSEAAEPVFRDVSSGVTSWDGGQHSHNVPFLLTDADWQIVSSNGLQDEQRLRAGQPISWVQPPMFVAGSPAARGVLKTPSGTRLSLVSRLDGGGYVVAYWPEDVLGLTAESLLTWMPASACLALLWICGLQGLAAYLLFSNLQANMQRKQTALNDQSHRQTQHLVRTQDAIIFGLARLAESRDPETGNHLERISQYVTLLASAMQEDERFCDVVTPSFVRLIGPSSILHDIGKVGVEDAILLKPGPLTDEERVEMQKHTTIGAECIEQIERQLGSSNFLQMAREITLHHHERWDGGGYPTGLAGEEIPLAARITAIADVYDALSVRRIYKPAYSHTRCVDMIEEASGTQFDPELVQVFLKLEEQFERVAQQYNDDDVDENSEGTFRESITDVDELIASLELDEDGLPEAANTYAAAAD